MIYAVDFDGTLCEDRYPKLGPPIQPMIDWLRKARRKGDKLILWTCRVGRDLEEAVNFCEDHGLIFDAVNDNLPENVEKYGGNPRKVFADVYIDDRNCSPRVAAAGADDSGKTVQAALPGVRYERLR